MVKKNCDSINVAEKATAIFMLTPVARILIGKISLGMSTVRGFQDQPKPAA